MIQKFNCTDTWDVQFSSGCTTRLSRTTTDLTDQDDYWDVNDHDLTELDSEPGERSTVRASS